MFGLIGISGVFLTFSAVMIIWRIVEWRRIRQEFAQLRKQNPSLYTDILSGNLCAALTRSHPSEQAQVAKRLVHPSVLQTWPVWNWHTTVELHLESGQKKEEEVTATLVSEDQQSDSCQSLNSTCETTSKSTTPPTPNLPVPSTSTSPSDHHAPHCPICLEPYHPGSTLRTIPCGHSYHVSCIDKWLCCRIGQCPVCRNDVAAASGKPHEDLEKIVVVV
ncbi:hypothetical protein M427DRAFT_285875 [Gonapodya prolifera JEL478]|uniref:RING-type E3 ubiquitin transferase n=1 Tax=Gonapodya prolifera (strain JEL478) TaxID=1344416 RepID=A0A139AK07_GONPJ|nr:hypothetical protein M427DRAFT_285875 [Gonapodya prolifera JEL478]|eukprot:KXS16833.1 hypothetical protein M427DRAFT_285875 [Gonapodya prolifera JEL478]